MISERSEAASKSDARSLRHNSSSGRTPERSLPHGSSGKESTRSLAHELSGRDGGSSLRQIREGEADSNGRSQHGESMNSSVIDLLTTKCAPSPFKERATGSVLSCLVKTLDLNHICSWITYAVTAA